MRMNTPPADNPTEARSRRGVPSLIILSAVVTLSIALVLGRSPYDTPLRLEPVTPKSGPFGGKIYVDEGSKLHIPSILISATARSALGLN
ncbi:MAG: hypothetical protein M5R36_20295 [Deltaproteobacteria bacterium]|nr:hypothetical protein [Deltaproteobacteria bacterium]